MKDLHERGAGRKQKISDAAPCRGEFEATREAWIRWLTKGRRLRSEVKLFGTSYISLYASRKVHNDQRALVAWADVRTLADEFGVSKSAADRAVKRLLKRGYLSRWNGDVPRSERHEDRRGRPSTAYRFTMPPAEYFSTTWREKLTRILSRLTASSGTNNDGILSRLMKEFVPLNETFCPAQIQEVPVAVGVTPGLSDIDSLNNRLAECSFALRAPSGELIVPEWNREQLDEIALLRALPNGDGVAWGEIIFTTSDGKPMMATPTIEEFVFWSSDEELGEYLKEEFYGDDPVAPAPAPTPTVAEQHTEREARERREQEFRAKHNIAEGEPLF